MIKKDQKKIPQDYFILKPCPQLEDWIQSSQLVTLESLPNEGTLFVDSRIHSSVKTIRKQFKGQVVAYHAKFDHKYNNWDQVIWGPLRPWAFEEMLKESEQSQNSHKVKSLKILIVDDCDDSRWAMKKHLEFLGVLPLEVDNGEFALNICKNNHFDAIMMDLQMPHLNGIETFQKLQKMGVRCPVVAISGNLENRMNLMNRGFSDFWHRPISFTQIEKFLSSISFSSEQIDYLQNRKNDIRQIKEYLKNASWTEIETIGHKIKGNAAIFGYPQLGPIGELLEQYASQQNLVGVQEAVVVFDQYLNGHS